MPFSAWLLPSRFPPAAGAAYPEKPIKIIVPFAAGGRTDVTTRLFQRVIEQHNLLPQKIVVINVDGGGGVTGGRQAKDQPADGYNLLAWHVGMLTSAAAGKAKYGPEAFEPIAETGATFYIYSASPKAPFKTFDEFVTAAKKSRKRSARRPASTRRPILHRCRSPMRSGWICVTSKARDIEAHQPAGRRARRCGPVLGAGFHAPEGAGIVPLMAMAEEPVGDTLPGLKTMKEMGYDTSWTSGNWWFAPKGTPKEAIDTFADALEAAMTKPEIIEAFEKGIVAPTFLRSQALAKKIDARWPNWSSSSSSTVSSNRSSDRLAVPGASCAGRQEC